MPNQSGKNTVNYLTTSTAPALTLGSLAVTETLAVKEPSILNTTHSVLGGMTVKKKSKDVWSPLKIINKGVWIK